MIKSVTLAAIIAIVSCSCHRAAQSRQAGSDNNDMSSAPCMSLPRAVVYKTNGDYDNNVTVTLTPDRLGLLSYPSPSDVGLQSVPLKLADGWLLDRRGGIGENTAFLKYDYAAFAKLDTLPSPSQLLQSVIKSARVTSAVSLPMTLSEALNDTSACNRLISNGFPGCRFLTDNATIQITE